MIAIAQAPDRLRDALRVVPEMTTLQLRLLESVIIILLMVLLRWIAVFLISRNTTDPRLRYNWSKTITYASSFLAIFLIGRLWFEGFRAIATFLGLVGAGLAVALKEPVQNMAGWIFLLWRRPFGVGDRIQIGPHAGDVVDQRLFQFTLLEIGNWVDADQSTGRLIHIPNGKVFVDPIANYTRGFPYVWNEVNVPITFESDWEVAKGILLDVVQKHGAQFTRDAEQDVLAASQRFLIFYSTLAPTVYTSVREFGVVLTMRYICEARRRRDTTQAIWEDVLRAFALRDDIAWAYPTRRVVDMTREVKSTLRPAGRE